MSSTFTSIIIILIAVVRAIIKLGKRAKIKAKSTGYTVANPKVQKLREGLDDLHSEMVKTSKIGRRTRKNTKKQEEESFTRREDL